MKKQKKQENKIKKQEAIQEQKQSLKYIWNYLKSYKSQFLFVVVSSLLISIFNAGVIIGQYYFMDYIQQKEPKTLGVSLFATFLLLFIVTIAILFVFQTRVMAKIAQYVGKSIRKDMYFKILELKLSYFDQNPSGDIMSRLTNDINNITNALTQNVTQFLINISQICFMLISLIIFSPILSIVPLVLAVVQIGVIILLFKRAQPNFLKKQESLGDINGYIEETISGQKVINNFNKQSPTIEKFRIKNENIRKIDYTTQSLSMVVDPWNTFISSMIITIMLIVAISLGMNNIEIGGAVSSLGDNGKTNLWKVMPLINAVLLFTRNYSNPIYQIFQMLYLLQAALAGSKRAFAIKHEPIEINDKERIEVKSLKGEVIFKNLTFSYDGKKDVLKNINLTVKPGQVVGIVGPTGSGKTTIINLLTKFYDVTNEESDIIIDGRSIKELTKHSLRDEVSIVLQDTYVFNDNIYQNLRYAKLDATNEEIEQAAKFANADHFISSLENGYETILDNNADELSQGEKQLLAIARAFLKQSSILILDEATSSIDTKTEKDIQTGMINLSKGKTTFMIAHRLSTIKHADIIIVLKDGQILEQGNHNELIKMKGFYANMYNSKLNTPEDL